MKQQWLCTECRRGSVIDVPEGTRVREIVGAIENDHKVFSPSCSTPVSGLIITNMNVSHEEVENNFLKEIAKHAFTWRKTGGWEKIVHDGGEFHRFSSPNMFARDLIGVLLKYEVWLERNGRNLTPEIGAIGSKARTKEIYEESDE